MIDISAMTDDEVELVNWALVCVEPLLYREYPLQNGKVADRHPLADLCTELRNKTARERQLRLKRAAGR